MPKYVIAKKIEEIAAMRNKRSGLYLLKILWRMVDLYNKKMNRYKGFTKNILRK